MKDLSTRLNTKTITLSWYDDDETLLYFRFGKTWDWEEFFQLDAESDRLVSEKNYVVDTIFDFSATIVIPNNLLTNFIRAARGSGEHPNHGVTVVFGVGVVVKLIGSSIQRLVRSDHIVMAENLNDALAKLEIARAKRQTPPK